MPTPRQTADAQQRELDRAAARGHARKLAALLKQHGVYAARYWEPATQRGDYVPPRVYVGGQYLSVSRGGTVDTASRRRVESGLRPHERVAFRKGMDAYLAYQDDALHADDDDGTEACGSCGASFNRTGPPLPLHHGRPQATCPACQKVGNPGGRRANPYRRFPRRFPSDATDLEDYYATGVQDAGNVCDADMFDFDKGGTVDQIVNRLVRSPEFKEQWLEQDRDQVVEDGLDPDKAFEAWREGWSRVAHQVVKGRLDDIARDEREGNPSRRPRRGNPRLSLGDEVIEGMARAIWVTAYADWVEESAPKAWRGKMKPTGGGDWNRVAPATPESAYQAAAQLVVRVEAANDATVPHLVEVAALADERRASDKFADAFGHALAMQALGTGVTWFDDHARFPLKVPHVEAWTSDGQELEWSPQATTNPARARSR